MGMGDCAAVCEYGAINICNGMASIDPAKCRGCAKCTAACPKGLISFVPLKKQAVVRCSNCDKGAETMKDVYKRQEWIGRDDAFPVKGRCLSSQLMSVPDCQAIIKKAVVESLKEAYKLEHFPETGANYQIQFLIMKDKVSIMLDTSCLLYTSRCV